MACAGLGPIAMWGVTGESPALLKIQRGVGLVRMLIPGTREFQLPQQFRMIHDDRMSGRNERAKSSSFGPLLRRVPSIESPIIEIEQLRARIALEHEIKVMDSGCTGNGSCLGLPGVPSTS